MNYLISRRYETCLQADTDESIIVNTRYCIEFVIIFYAVAFYAETRSKKLVNKNIVKLLQLEFQKKSPLVSSWVKLLNYSYAILDKEKKGFKEEAGIHLQEMSNFCLPTEKHRQIIKNSDIRHLLNAYLTI